jgi:hypothetical protein
MEIIVIRLRTQRGYKEYFFTLTESDDYWLLTLYHGNTFAYLIKAPTIIGCLYNCAIKIRKLGQLVAISDNPISVMLQGYLNMIEEKEIISLIQHPKAS